MRLTFRSFLFSTVTVSTMLVPGLSANALSFDDSLRAALGNSLTLKSSRSSWLSAQENIGTAESTSEWRATGSLVGTHNKTDAKRARKSGFLDAQSASATVSLTKNLYDGGQTDENTRLREIQRDLAAARYRVAEQQVILSTVETYLNLIKTRREVSLNEANLARLGEHVEAAQARLDAGAGTQTQVAQAEARQSRAQTALISAVTAMRNAEDGFITLTGQMPGDLDSVVNQGNLPASLIEADKLGRDMHPNVTVAKLSVIAAEQELNSLIAALRPNLAFSLSAAESMAEGILSDKTEFSARMTLSTPLMPSLSSRAKSRSLSAALESAKLSRDSTLRDISLNVRNNFRNMETSRAQSAAVEAELKASRLVAEGINNEFQFGQKTVLDLLDAEQDVIDAELREVSAEHAILLAIFRLHAATGQLTSDALGMSDVLGPLEETEARKVRFKTWLPLQIEWEDEADKAKDGSTDTSSADLIENKAKDKDKVAALPIKPAMPVESENPVTSPVLVGVVTDAAGRLSAGDIDSTVRPVKVAAVADEEGVVIWNIQTAIQP